MKKLVINISIIGGIYLVYRILVFFTILSLNNSQYGLNTFLSDLNYGNDNKSKQLIVLGSSNTRYNFNYKQLNETFKTRAVHSVSSSSPYGLYFTLDKFINSKWNNTNNIVIIDLPYSLYSEDQFLPLTAATMRLMTVKYAKKLLITHPKELFSYAFNESFLNRDVVDSMLAVIKNYTHNINNRSNIDNGLVVSSAQNFNDGYLDCTTPYVKEMHFLQDVSLTQKHLSYIKSYVNDNIKCKVYYLFPEINKNNTALSPTTINAFLKNFKPINTFESSQFVNNQMYDQWYHLNKCGAEMNTQNLLINLDRLGIAY